HTECCPVSGSSYIIRTTKKPHRILGLKNGQTEVLEKPIPGGGNLWHCHDKNNWYGFCNSVSGTYLSHNEGGKVLATKNSLEIDECFVPRREKGGGYILLTCHEKELLQVAISDDGKSLVEKKEGGEAWEFI
ncbi:uncharacterized protein TRIVIDRAFT_121509, partial [Trichoderma virens Gv29-8]